MPALKRIANQYLTTSSGNRKDEQTKPNSSRRKEIIEIREEIKKKKIGIRKTIPKEQ